ncbi:MAG: hypothetical protein K6T83_21670 [Alicyclobacillus sp.]|nr:hypothetical protein [Alicyclobacillus sp.]
MHSKETVWYICRRTVRGDQVYERYYKRELLTTDSYRNLDSLYWSDERPITRRTWKKAQREGYKCDTYTLYLPPVELIQFPFGGVSHEGTGESGNPPQTGRGPGKVVRLLRYRLSKSLGLRDLPNSRGEGRTI